MTVWAGFHVSSGRGAKKKKNTLTTIVSVGNWAFTLETKCVMGEQEVVFRVEEGGSQVTETQRVRLKWNISCTKYMYFRCRFHATERKKSNKQKIHRKLYFIKEIFSTSAAAPPGLFFWMTLAWKQTKQTENHVRRDADFEVQSLDLWSAKGFQTVQTGCSESSTMYWTNLT